jgi:hypothetical protein
MRAFWADIYEKCEQGLVSVAAPADGMHATSLRWNAADVGCDFTRYLAEDMLLLSIMERDAINVPSRLELHKCIYGWIGTHR